MTRTAVLGYPRIGAGRELKKALERYWSADIDEASLKSEAARIRAAHWATQAKAGIDIIPCGDFSLYDHVLDTAAMVGAVPARYRGADVPGGFGFGDGAGQTGLAAYFAMARGIQSGGADLPALEMTKWFDTNYHYIVPEISAGQEFRLTFTQATDALAEAKAAGIAARPVLLGPVTFLSLAKSADGGPAPLSLLDRILPVYGEILERLARAGAAWVQMDEPLLVTDLSGDARAAYTAAYDRLARTGVKIMLTTYFGELKENLDLALKLPVAGLHVDLVRGPAQGAELLKRKPRDLVLSLGLVDGRNVWRSDLEALVKTARPFVDAFGSDRVIVAPSCSLLHCPEDLAAETSLDQELLGWLAFSRQKLDELAIVARALNEGVSAVAPQLAESTRLRQSRRTSPRIHSPRVQERLASLTPAMSRRASAYAARRAAQETALKLPLFPTTTIGSFPQTQKVRAARAERRAGTITQAQYEKFLEEEIARTVRLQESIGLDVLVHGEFERNDMVEHFGEMLSGFAFTRNGWVQSYGSRCVKPPIIFGDVERPKPMTVRWSAYAQSLTKKPMKGMLTGPVTILAWSFVRDDQPRSATCRQIALAIRDEVKDLESSGIVMIQIDEPALREGLPLRRDDRAEYLAWAVESFRVASSGVKDTTQVHTHMCYSEFNDIVPSIAAMDADVISVESARSRMELLGAFRAFRYPNEIGPGVYDIHSPRVPSTDEMLALLEKALAVLTPAQLWVNPDCGLKTRQWKETEPALVAMVEAARKLRERHPG
jgi:5-methyltetrahydropteroyltriglutamate--homocysteine methyltransferase